MGNSLSVGDVSAWLERQFPPALAGEWDNVGLLLGDRSEPVERMMTCLTLTPESVGEAIRERVQLVITHHPLPFHPLKRITTDSPAGSLIWRLASAGIAVFSPHTAFDSAGSGINRMIADRIGLGGVVPLVPADAALAGGTGRKGDLPRPLDPPGFARRLAEVFPDALIRFSALPGHQCRSIAIACGSGASLLSAAIAGGCDSLVTGEASFHQCLEARALGIAIFLTGHYQSERFAVEELAVQMAGEFAGCRVWASRDEADPLERLSKAQ